MRGLNRFLFGSGDRPASDNASLRNSGLFDETWYRERYPDLAPYQGSALEHFLNHGRHEERAPGPSFNPRWYSDLYCREFDGRDAFSHYVTVGRDKGYRPLPPYANGRRVAADRRDALLLEHGPSRHSRVILIRTCEDDAFRLYYALASIARFGSGFERVVVVCPETAGNAIQSVVDAFTFASLRTCPSYPNDYIGQQVTKLLAYQYVTENIVIHVDSDCVFTEPVDFAHYMRGNRPILFYRTYHEIYRHFHMAPWQEPTSRFLRRQVNHEFMCGFPMLHPRQLYVDLHAWFRRNHNFDYQDIPHHLTGPSAFSEFNLLGAFSYYGGATYHFHDDTGGGHFNFKCRQFCRGSNRADRRMSVDELNEIEAIIGQQ